MASNIIKPIIESSSTAIRPPLFVVDTPYSPSSRVACYMDTFTIHLPLERHMCVALQVAGETTLSNPSLVGEGTTNPQYLMYINQDIRSPNSKAPFVVIVDPEGNPLPVVASMGFRRDLLDVSRVRVLWARGSNE